MVKTQDGNCMKAIVFSISFILSYSTMAGTMGDVASKPWYENLEISAEGGPNWLNSANTTETISPYEIDNVLVHNISNNGTWKVGIGYYMPDEFLSQRAYLNHFLFEVNVYQISGTIKGDVWQYQPPAFNNYSYQTPFTSTRLMFDFKPYLFTYNHISPYLILGIGSAWDTLSYSETIVGTDVPANSNLVLGKQTTTQLAGNLGIGLIVPLTKHLNVTGEYLYGFMGNASPASTPANGVALQNSARFLFQTQSAYFGLSLRI